LTLETGDDVPEECEPVGEVPLMLPYGDPLTFDTTQPEWEFRLPLAANAVEIRDYVEYQAGEVCNPAFGSPFTLLRLSLGSSGGCVPFLAGIPTGGVCSSPHGSCGVASQTVDLDPVRYRTHIPLTTWRIVAHENAADDSLMPGVVSASGSTDAGGNPIGLPATFTGLIPIIVPEGEGTNGNRFEYYFVADCP
jgi:hypothetical protein